MDKCRWRDSSASNGELRSLLTRQVMSSPAPLHKLCKRWKTTPINSEAACMGSPWAAAAALFQLYLILKALLSDVRGIRKTYKNGNMSVRGLDKFMTCCTAQTCSNRPLILLTRDSTRLIDADVDTSKQPNGCNLCSGLSRLALDIPEECDRMRKK